MATHLKAEQKQSSSLYCKSESHTVVPTRAVSFVCCTVGQLHPWERVLGAILKGTLPKMGELTQQKCED